MRHDDDIETKTEKNRSNHKFFFDRSINFGNLLALIGVIFTIIIVYNQYRDDLVKFRKAVLRTEIMWEYFIKEHTDINQYDIEKGR